MNKQEVIDSIKKEAKHHCGEDECYRPGCGRYVELGEAVNIISQLDEPKKVVVPKFVAEWIQKHGIDRDQFEIVWIAKNYVNGITSLDLGCENVTSWIAYNPEAFARAWLDGYEVEREKLYTVKIPNASSNILHRNIRTGRYIFHSGNGLKGYTNKLTESEIRKDFDWAWQAGFAKEVE